MRRNEKKNKDSIERLSLFFLCNFFHLRFTKHPSLYYSLNETYIVRMYRIEAITQVNKNNKD